MSYTLAVRHGREFKIGTANPSIGANKEAYLADFAVVALMSDSYVVFSDSEFVTSH